jgi:prolyl-tRNA synthetase
MAGAKTAITPTRAEDFAAWYQAVVQEADLAEMAHVRGCMVIKPWGFGIWDRLKTDLDEEIRARGHENVYFPVFIPLSYLEKEAAHVEGFAKEMAVVTHHRLEAHDGKLVPAAELSEPIIVRPTSETIIGASMAKWIQSYRDLPMLLNQWANVVRWEMRPRVFLRTSEFLWQEGHTAHATHDEAMAETLDIHSMYREFVEGVLAVPVIPGEKPPSERFPGAERSFSIEAMMQDGKALQAGTSHYLGQNFARAAGIDFLDERGEQVFAYTTSWGVSTRLIGALIMTHGDDDGLRVPPAVAPDQVVIVPILRGTDEDVDEKVLAYARRLGDALSVVGVRARVDETGQRSVEKKWKWVKRGAPLLCELGPKDEAGEMVTVRTRTDAANTEQEPFAAFVAGVVERLERVQTFLRSEAQARLDTWTRRDVCDLAAAERFFADEQGFVLAKWCGESECESGLKHLGVTIRCLPTELEADCTTCLICGGPASIDAIWAESY